MTRWTSMQVSCTCIEGGEHTFDLHTFAPVPPGWVAAFDDYKYPIYAFGVGTIYINGAYPATVAFMAPYRGEEASIGCVACHHVAPLEAEA